MELHLIKAYIAHLEDLTIQSEIRTRARAEQKHKMMSKTFEEYAWRDPVESGDLKKLLVSELNKYLKHYKLVSSDTKAEKIRRISLHVLRGNHGQQEDTNEFTDEETKECGTEDDSEEIDSSGDDESEDIVLGELLSGLTQTKTRSRLHHANGNVIASMKVKRYGLSFKAIQMRRNFMVLIEFANS